MILLAKEKEIGTGCANCKFMQEDKCLIDERVSIKTEDGEVNQFRPYVCPFRYFESEVRQITNCMHGMTPEETKGWFEGADHEHKHFIELEMNRDRFVASEECLNDSK